ncbi:3D domain-containing protein [Paenibacillus alvei]|uniref:3D domain-containing protein n=1 Tax=Paenibacillus alvei TaxID=44250 RepID=UPI00227E1382|nr:3D domain-containing protein [Paenibacillus alvei]MCY9757718.1 3D domain-containing protein [Paenibacillus alvei]
MEKTNKRVPKRLVTIPALAILLATLATTGSSHGHEAKAKNVEPQSVMYYNPLMDKALEDMKKKVEEERKREEVVIAAEAKTVEKPVVKPVIKEKKKEAPKSKKVDPDDGDWETYRLTYYGMDCNGCSGVTASGIDVGDATEYDGYKVLSVDPKKIPLGSIVRINDGDSTFEAIAIDTGGAIKGNKLDLLVGSEKESYKYGVKKIKLKVVREGWQGKRK